MFFLLLIALLGTSQETAASCPSSSIAVPSQNLCIEMLMTNLTFCEAETQCKAIGGRLFQPNNTQSVRDVKQALMATPEGKNIEAAWIGIVSDPTTGKDLFLDGTDATNQFAPPLFWVNTKNSSAYSDEWESCWFALPNSTECKNVVKQTLCYVEPLRRYSTNPKADYDLFLQFIKIQVNMTPEWRNDPSCVRLVNRTFFKRYTPEFNMKKTIGGSHYEREWWSGRPGSLPHIDHPQVPSRLSNEQLEMIAM